MKCFQVSAQEETPLPSSLLTHQNLTKTTLTPEPTPTPKSEASFGFFTLLGQRTLDKSDALCLRASKGHRAPQRCMQGTEGAKPVSNWVKLNQRLFSAIFVKNGEKCEKMQILDENGGKCKIWTKMAKNTKVAPICPFWAEFGRFSPFSTILSCGGVAGDLRKMRDVCRISCGGVAGDFRDCLRMSEVRNFYKKMRKNMKFVEI